MIVHRAAAFASALVLLAGAAWAGVATPDDTARVLAGLQPSAGSPLAAITSDPGWHRHARSADRVWQELESRQLSRIRAWSSKHLTNPRPVMFYMFSGPDFLYANAIFPKATTYVLSGLEPVGAVPDVTTIPRKSLAAALAGLQTSLNSVTSFSFFITQHMSRDLNSGHLKGTLPVIYVFLARSGKTIKDVALVRIDENGKLVQPTEPAWAGGVQGAKITFTEPGDEAERTLYYFSGDISDRGAKGTYLLKFAESLGTGNALLKSASYLMHDNNFSRVRQFVLSNSDTLVQDDSGIPLRFFDPAEWHLQPFGSYLGPISLFKGSYQPKLKALFGQGKVQPLDFGIGYRWRMRESNLLLAVRKRAVASERR